MLRGLYAAASGMMTQLARQEVLADNLANASTAGFRRVQTSVGQFRQDLAAAAGATGSAAGGVAVQGAGLDTSDGILVRSDNPLDLALSGNAFFTVQTPRGVAYTRDGRFRLDAERRLVTGRGDLVLGQSGPLTLPAGTVAVTTAGQVSVDGKAVDTLRLAEPAQPKPLGDGLYSSGPTRPATGHTVSQGMVEQSNVNAVQEMGRMMNGNRLYEANATALGYQDSSLGALMRVLE
jgi:flagellar basal-body rod protein FlgG